MLTFLLQMLLSVKTGVATNFSAHDKFNPQPYAACLHRNLRDSDVVVAHPTLPCNSRVFIYAPRTGRSIIARIGDRGPRAAMIDLNVAVTKKLRANGMENVVMVSLQP